MREVSAYGYDPNGNVTSIETPRGSATQAADDFTLSFDYDPLDRLERETNAAGESFGYGYDVDSNPTLELDPLDHKTVLTNDDQQIRYGYDPRGFQSSWQTDGFIAGRDSARRITRESYPSGAMFERRGVKLIADGSEDPTREARSYSYFYNPNRSLAETVDHVPSFDGAPAGFDYDRQTVIACDSAERELRVNESWRGGRDTTFSYDPAGNVTKRRTDGKLVDSNGDSCTGSGAGCTYTGTDAASAEFTYDALDREQTLVRSSGGKTQSWQTSWWPTDELKSRTRMNGGLSADVAATDRRYFWPSGDPSARLHDPGSSEGPSTQTYAYDLNGNRTFDERGIHAFNARSQQTSWQRPDAEGAGSPPAGESYADPPGPMEARGLTTYVLDATGQNLTETSELDYKAKLTDDSRPDLSEHSRSNYRYVDGTLRQVVTTTSDEIDAQGGDLDTKTRTTATYLPHDDLGNVREIKSETVSLDPDGDDPPEPALGTEPAQVPGCESEISGWVRPTPPTTASTPSAGWSPRRRRSRSRATPETRPPPTSTTASTAATSASGAPPRVRSRRRRSVLTSAPPSCSAARPTPIKVGRAAPTPTTPRACAWARRSSQRTTRTPRASRATATTPTAR